MFSTRLTRLGIALVALPVALTSAARRWDPTGHKTIASIAWDHMTPHARAGAVALLRNGPPLAGIGSMEPTTGSRKERDRGLFIESATWPDYIRDTLAAFHVYHHGNWHYSDTFWKQEGNAVVEMTGRGPGPTNAIERLTALEAVLRNPGAADSTRAVALMWVMHLVGDIHQPLHMSARVTPALPDGDRGGNSFKLSGPVTNLHAYWDNILDIQAPLIRGEDSVRYVNRLRNRVERALPHGSVSATTLHGSYESWGAESLKLAEEMLYPQTLQEQQLPLPAYQAAADQIAERRIALAGYRLAVLLNGIFL